MPLRSTVSNLAAAPAPGALPTAPAPRLARRPGAYVPPANAPDLLAPDGAEEQATAPATEVAASAAPAAEKPARKPRKPRTPKVVASKPSPANADAQATRKLLLEVEGQLVELRAQVQKATERFQPRFDRLRARHAELSAALAQQLTQ